MNQADISGTSGPPSWMAPITPVVPDHELIRRIGGGSYGDVWLARTAVGTWRAVKVVFRDRFNDSRPYDREFHGIQKFEPLSRSNEAFVDVLQIGRNDADGYFYYVMELADDVTGGRSQPSSVISNPSVMPDAGQPQTAGPCSRNAGFEPTAYVPKTLSKVLLHRGRLPVDECLELGLSLNLGLAHLHRAGLIHRDIKPSNIIFVGGIPKLADIGLVIETSEARSFVGTEGYIPPEGPTSPQADLFSLGKVLYEAGMGKDRKDFPEPLTNLAEAPDALQVLEFNAILLRACAANPAERYKSAEEMNADLALLRSGGSVRQRNRIAGQLRFIRRAGWVAAGLAMLVAAGWVWQVRETRLLRELAADRARLVEAEQTRLIQLNTANGVRDMEDGRLAAAMLWLGEALSLSTNNPVDERLQRIRLRQLASQHPRLLHVLPHPAGVTAAALSDDGEWVFSACRDGTSRLWHLQRDAAPVLEAPLPAPAAEIRFLRDGRHLFGLVRDASGQAVGGFILDRATGKPHLNLPADHSAIALSPDEQWIAAADATRRIRIISTDTGQVLREISPLATRVDALAFSPDSSVLVAGCADGTLSPWDVRSGRPKSPVLHHAQPVLRVVFSRDGDRIATMTHTRTRDADTQYHVWDSRSGTSFDRPASDDEPGTIMTFSPDGLRLLTGDLGGRVRVRNADSMALSMPDTRVDGAVRCVAFSPDAAWVAVAGDSGLVRVLDAEGGLEVLPPLFHAGPVSAVQFNQDGSQLVTAADDGGVKIWDLTMTPEDLRKEIPSFAKAEVGVPAQGRYLILGVKTFPYEIHRFDWERFALEKVPFAEGRESGPASIVTSQDGRTWAASPGRPLNLSPVPIDVPNPSFARLWRKVGQQVETLELPHRYPVRGVFLRRDGSEAATIADDHHVRTWKTSDGSLLREFRWPAEDASWIDFSPDLRTALAEFQDERGRHLVLRDTETLQPLGPPPGSLPAPLEWAFSPDGKRLAVAFENHSCRIWDTHTGEPLTPWFQHTAPLKCIAWSPDGKRVLTAGQSSEIRIWDATTGTPASRPLTMNTRQVDGARFSRDGRYIVAWCDEKRVQVWDAENGYAITSPIVHDDYVRAALVTDSGRLVTVSYQCVLRAWDLHPEMGGVRDLIDHGRLLAGRTLERVNAPQPLTARQLSDILQSLRSRHPDLFTVPAARLTGWHQRRIRNPDTPNRVDAALFHLQWLRTRDPDNASLQRQWQEFQTLRIPPRDPSAPGRLLDLTRAYTESLEMAQHGDFAELPRGRQVLGGTEFDLRGLVRLDHRAERPDRPGPFHPAAVVEVGLSCRALHFLQAVDGEPRDPGSVVARWTIHYADGSSRVWPVIYGRHVLDWWWWFREESLEPAEARVVWRGHARSWNIPGTDGVRLFESVWVNPQPDIPVSRIEFRIGESPLKPFVVAVTAE